MASVAHKGNLPDGWIVKVSRTHPDRVYYFNVVTGSSTWECPKLSSSDANEKQLSKSSSALNKEVPKKHAEVLSETKSPDLLLPNSEIRKFLSDAKRESLRRSGENETPSGPTVHSKLSTPPTAVVAPLDKQPITQKKKKKRCKKKKSAASTVAAHTPPNRTLSSGTILERNDANITSKKVSFPIKSMNKIVTCRSEAVLKPKFTPVFKKKQSLVICLPSAKNSHGASANREKRSVVLDKSKVLPSSNDAKRKESEKRRLSLDQRFSPPLFRNDQPTSSKISNQIPNNENKRSSSGSKTNLDEAPFKSISKTLNESEDCEMEMDCEMNSDFEDLTVTVSSSSSKVNIGASTSRNSDDSLDIEMLDLSSSELVRIDDIFISGFQGSLLENYFIVVDTNVFISELKDIAELKDTPVNGRGPPHFVIPWVVFQELDNLKRNGGRPKNGATKENNVRKTYDLKKSATEAIRYLNSLLKAKHPRFHFQRPDEAQFCRKDFSRNNDDQLLECCMKLRERLERENVILLTNDKNLANKSMVLDIVVHDKSTLLLNLTPNSKILEKSRNVTPIPYIPEPFKVLAEHKSMEPCYEANYRKCELEVESHMSTVTQMLKEVLDPMFEKEMDEAYGDAWHFFPVERHVLSGILKGIVKYWRTVFTFFFSIEHKEKFETLCEKASRPEGFLGERSECLQILELINDLFVVIKRKWPTIHVPIIQIQKLKEVTEKAFCNLSECEKSFFNIESVIREAEISCCIEVFNHNWTVINYLCGCTSDFVGLHHKLVYDNTAPIPPRSEFLSTMPRLHNSLNQLKGIMEKMIVVVKSSKPNDAVFKELHKMLTELVPSLNIQGKNLVFNYFSPKLLERFCRLPENRDRIEEGYKQLLTFYETLDKALPVLLKAIP